MDFSDIVGHDRQKQLLLQAIDRQRLAHAYLFAGPDGIGKRQVALGLALQLLCQHRRGCGQCPACRKVAGFNHPDLHLLDSPEQSIKIEQIRELQRRLVLHPLEGEIRICLIDRAERLTTAAANALLKTLEEPQSGTLLILLSSQPDSLLPTIRSRCQGLTFKRLKRDQTAHILSRQLELSEQQATVLAALTDGSLGKALGENRELYLENRGALIETLSALPTTSSMAAFSFAEDLAADKDQLPDILHIFETYYRDILLLKLGTADREVINLDLLDSLRQRATALSVAKLLTILDALKEARAQLQRNVNRQLAMDVMLNRIVAA